MHYVDIFKEEKERYTKEERIFRVDTMQLTIGSFVHKINTIHIFMTRSIY